MRGQHAHGNRGRIAAGVIALTAGVVASAAIAAAGSSIKLSGHATNTIGQSFSIKMSGYAAAPANRVVAGEQTSVALKCAAKFTAENPRSDYYGSFVKTVGKNKRFKNLSVNFSAVVPGTHALCAYVISSTTFKTYASAEFKWTNEAATGPGGTLEPAQVGHGQCQATKYADGSVTGQIAIENTTCTVASPVEAAADGAKGAPYTAAGFSCKATQEGAGSQWASSWTGTYFAYSCKSGSEQVAFNWGLHYSFSG